MLTLSQSLLLSLLQFALYTIFSHTHKKKKGIKFLVLRTFTWTTRRGCSERVPRHGRSWWGHLGYQGNPSDGNSLSGRGSCGWGRAFRRVQGQWGSGSDAGGGSWRRRWNFVFLQLQQVGVGSGHSTPTHLQGTCVGTNQLDARRRQRAVCRKRARQTNSYT